MKYVSVFFRYIMIFVISIVLSSSNSYSDEKSVECNFDVSAIDFDKGIIEGRKISFLFTNNTEYSLMIVDIDFDIISDKRPLPLYSSYIREAKNIPGALLPDESIVFIEYHFMGEREKQLAQDANELTINTSVNQATTTEGLVFRCIE